MLLKLRRLGLEAERMKKDLGDSVGVYHCRELIDGYLEQRSLGLVLARTGAERTLSLVETKSLLL